MKPTKFKCRECGMRYESLVKIKMEYGRKPIKRIWHPHGSRSRSKTIVQCLRCKGVLVPYGNKVAL